MKWSDLPTKHATSTCVAFKCEATVPISIRPVLTPTYLKMGDLKPCFWSMVGGKAENKPKCFYFHVLSHFHWFLPYYLDKGWLQGLATLPSPFKNSWTLVHGMQYVCHPTVQNYYQITSLMNRKLKMHNGALYIQKPNSVTNPSLTQILTTNFSGVDGRSSNQIRISDHPLISGGVPAHGTTAVLSQPQRMIGVVLSIWPRYLH